MRVLRNIFVAIIAIVGIAAFTAASANAGVRIKISGGPVTQPDGTIPAGSHPDLPLVADFPDSASNPTQNVIFNLPPGLIGSPGATQDADGKSIKCQPVKDGPRVNGKQKYKLPANGCPDSTQVGTAQAQVEVTIPGLELLPIPLTVNGKIYNMAPTGEGEPANLAARLISDLPNIPGLIGTDPIDSIAKFELNSPGNYGLRNELTDLPKTTKLTLFGNVVEASVRLKQFSYTFWGDRPQYKEPFVTMPTTCVPATITAKASGYDDPNDYGKQSGITFTPSACDKVPFAATQTITAIGADLKPLAENVFQSGQPSGVAVTLSVPQGNNMPQCDPPQAKTSSCPVMSHVKHAEVVLPPGMALSAGVGANGLEGCTDDQFGYDKFKRPDCPDASIIGSVTFNSPLVGELNGRVYLGMPTAESPLRTLLYVGEGDTQVKLIGRSIPDPTTGQVTTVFDNLPQQPFSDFTLRFRGGPNAVLKAPDACGDAESTGTLEPFATGGTPITVKSTITTVGCQPAQFAPQFTASADPTTAGANTTLTTTITRSDADAPLLGTRIAMPGGLLGNLAAIPQCPLAQAKAGSCPEETRIGTVITKAGTGDTPATLQGGVYLTEGFDGAIAGLGILVPASVGPIDLGTAAVLGKIAVRKDLGIDLAVDSVPNIVGGVPLYLKEMKIVLNKPGFMFNSSSCAPQKINASFTSPDGQTASGSADYQATDCGALPFDPNISAVISGDKLKPGFSTRILGKSGDATLEATQLTLPAAISARLAKLKDVCPQADYNVGNCKPGAIIGNVRAESPIIPLPLTGPVTAVALDGVILPALAIKLTGPVSFDLIVTNAVTGGRLVSTIGGVPDAPISVFDLNLTTDGLLAGDNTLCTKKQTMEGKFTSHTGAVVTKQVDVNTDPACKAVGPAGPVSARGTLKGIKKGRTASLTVKLSGKNRKITSVRVGVPRKQLTIVRSKVKRNARGIVGGKYVSKNRTFSTTSSKSTGYLTVRSSQAGKKYSSSIEIRMSKGALRKQKIKVGQKVTLTLRYYESGSTKAKTMKIKVTAKS